MTSEENTRSKKEGKREDKWIEKMMAASNTWIASDRWVCKKKHLGISWYLSDNNTTTQASEKVDILKHTCKKFECQ